MELEIYESELADYSLQDSPFYEASTPIIFGSSASVSEFATINAASMVDALNLSSKKTSMMMSAKCHSLKLAFERSTTANMIDRANDGQSSIESDDITAKKRCQVDDRFYATKGTDLDSNATERNAQPKKKRKCVSFQPNFVQVNYIIRLYHVWGP